MPVQGLDEFEDFVDDIREVAGQGRSDGIGKAKRDALRETGDDIKGILKEIITSMETSQGGTLDSSTSPYSPGGTNDSTTDNLHMSNKNAWNFNLADDGHAVVFPNPKIRDRVRFINYGTRRHGPQGDTPMYFNVAGRTIVVADRPGKQSPFRDPYSKMSAVDGTIPALFTYGDIEGESGEVEGVEAKHFLNKATRVAFSRGVLKDNMEREIVEEFAENDLELE